jgi:hypothetical protein
LPDRVRSREHRGQQRIFDGRRPRAQQLNTEQCGSALLHPQQSLEAFLKSFSVGPSKKSNCKNPLPGLCTRSSLTADKNQLGFPFLDDSEV